MKRAKQRRGALPSVNRERMFLFASSLASCGLHAALAATRMGETATALRQLAASIPHIRTVLREAHHD